MGFKVIVCDDDELILQGLKKFIPWAELELELVGSGVNGKEAIGLIDRFNPHVIVSDIRMPFIDGLELIKYAKGKNKDVIVIFISGYDDFRYAQQAVKHGAMDYILKPIDEDALIERLKVAVNDCKSFEKSKNINQEHQQYLTEKMIGILIYEGPEQFLEKATDDLFDSKFLDLFCNVTLVKLDAYEQLSLKMSSGEVDKLYKFLIRSCQNLLQKSIGIFSYENGSIGVYFINDKKTNLINDRNMVIQSIQNQFEQFFPDRTISFACGNVYRSILKLQESFQEAKIAEKEKFIQSVGSVIHYSELKNKKNDKNIKGLESVLVEIDFVTLIKQGDMNQIDVKLEKLRELLLSIGGKSYLYMTMVVANVYMGLMKELQQLGIEEDGFSLDLLKEYQMISKSISVDEVIQNLRKSLSIILEYVSRNSNRYSKVVNKATEYINNNFSNHLLSIDEVADYVHMSSSYFSMIFKNEMNTAFTDYLIGFRIEKAKDYIKNTDFKIYEISDKVGYDTAAYFSTAFKKSIGMSPTEYKKVVCK